MHPILLTLGPVTVYSYGVLLVAAFLSGTWLASREAERLPREQAALSGPQVVDLACLSLVGAILGARLFYVGLYWDVFRRYPQEILALWRGGLIWYGGMGGAVLAGWAYVRRQGLSVLRVADHMSPFMAFGHAIGRIGCFLQGCCYGRPTTAWWGITLPGHGERVIPTQLLEMAGLLGLYALLRGAQRTPAMRPPGRVSGVYLLGYALLRLVVESLRGDQTVWWAGLTLQQLVSMGVGLGGLALVGRTLTRSSVAKPA